MATNGTAAEQATAAKPPYIPFSTVEGFVARLHANGTTPPRIDKRMMSNLAGGVQSHLLAALRFLGLIEGTHNDVTATFEKLVESYSTPGYKETLRVVIDDAYSDIIGDIDIAKANAKQVDDAFMACKLDGTMRDRAMRFYLKALSTAGATISPYVVQRKPRSNGAAKAKKAKAKVDGETPTEKNKNPDGGAARKPELPIGMIEFPIPIGDGACIRVPATIENKDMPVVKAILQIVEAMAVRNSGAQQ